MVAYQTKPPGFGRVARGASSSSPEGRAVRTLVSSWVSGIAEKSRTGRRDRFGVCAWNVDIDTPIFYTNSERVSTDRMTVFRPEICGRLTKPLIYN